MIVCWRWCVPAAAGSSVIHTGTDSSTTYIRHTIQIHISVPFISGLCDVTMRHVPTTMKTHIHRLIWVHKSKLNFSHVAKQEEKVGVCVTAKAAQSVCVEVKEMKQKDTKTKQEKVKH